MNANTISGFIGGTKTNQIGLQTLAAITETEFRVNTDNGVGAIAVLTVPQGNEILGISNPINPAANAAILGLDRGSQMGRGLGENAPYFSTTSFDMAKGGSSFRLRLSGFATAVANAGNTFTLSLHSGVTKAGTLIGSITGATATAASLNFVYEADVSWDSTQLIIGGTQRGRITYNGTSLTFNAGTALTVASVTTLAGLSFVATTTWGNAVGGIVQVTEFVLEGI
jgi:hypothetical protein